MLSVILPTRNRAEFLRLALRSIERQTLVPDAFEVIVVDNGSTDYTAKVLGESRLKNLRTIRDARPGLHVGRHAGLRAATGSVLVFADDDIEALPSWLEAIRDAFRNPETALVGGNNLPLFLAEPPSWLMDMWNSGKDSMQCIPALSILKVNRPQATIDPLYVWGCNFSIRKDVLLAAGGFHPDGMPDDLIRFRGDGETHVSRFIAESKLSAVFHPGASVYHKVTPERMTLRYLKKRGFNSGISYSYELLRSGSVKRSQLGIFRLKAFLKNARGGLQTLLYRDRALAAQRALERGFWEGFIHHQESYYSDAEIREWVHRPDYF